ncbi:MAG: hypothetical protein IMF10_06900 [Proteobacteria bacterium]|nr:hypothetical protein [Pseudomonadota bacterium]
MNDTLFAKIDPDFKRDELITLMGGGKSRKFSHSVQIKIGKLEARLRKLMKPRLSYRTEKIESINGKVVHLLKGLSFTSKKLSKTMENCDEITCFIATIGDGIEKEIALLTDDNRLSDAYIIDSMGSAAVEKMAEKFHQDMRNRYIAEGKSVTMRFSPGYCDWPIEEQNKLFSFFDPASTGVELTDSCLMLPRKSISGIFGILPSNMPVYNPCSECGRTNCPHRRN